MMLRVVLLMLAFSGSCVGEELIEGKMFEHFAGASIQLENRQNVTKRVWHGETSMYYGVDNGVSRLLPVMGVWLGAIWSAELRAAREAAAAIDKGRGETFVVACPAGPLPVEQTATEEPPTRGHVLRVGEPAALTAAVLKAQPGDEIVIEDGIWRDVHVRIVGNGAGNAPIHIHPATPGGLQITGVSRVRIGGSHLVVSGLRLRNIHDVSDWFQFREDSKSLSRHCRVTDCVFEEDRAFDPGKMDSRWVGLYGENNEFDHCRVEGKKSRGTSVAIWLQEGLDARHHLHHNLFGYRPPLGRNGGETIRVGDSKAQSVDASCLFEKNVFEHCNGEAECISNKSCENEYRLNLFREVQGTLSLRHGHRCRVIENAFLGNDVKHTGGIRIIGEDHVVRGNYLANLGGRNARGALVLQNGIPNSPANGYPPVRRALVQDNHVIGCRESLVIGYADKDSPSSVVVPEDCIFSGNAFLADADKTAVTEHQAARNTQWKSNVATGKSLGIDEPAAGGLQFRPGAPSPDMVPPAPELKFIQSVGPSWDQGKSSPR